MDTPHRYRIKKVHPGTDFHSEINTTRNAPYFITFFAHYKAKSSSTLVLNLRQSLCEINTTKQVKLRVIGFIF